ncbi:winged helix DNA-binding domain-containing protein [Streptomyces inhibens]|uniref:Winged helix DNA-binding domain-containing protein n=1 Tax=Streptomyces inhibens TaxID=2293571 RepID=A0A371Q9A1_STRIH|nr:winged helix DNA-binding domain-containing protein [Streptomyces inhibens]REK91287.1 winged helix DNA-binding domain-containing protein [Streptomyces inhibens]
MTQRRTAPVLTARALGRATLDRQLLLRRGEMAVLDAVEWLVGLQAQAPRPPYYALAARLADFRPQELSGLLETRQAVRISAMRSTIHLVSARDARLLRPLHQPVHDRTLRGNFATTLAGVDLDRLAAAARTLVEQRPLTFQELGQRLQEDWPQHDHRSLSMAARQMLPLVQVTPRALWGRSGPAAHTTLDTWLAGAPRPAAEPGPAAEDPQEALAAVLLRYLAAFGPASVKDMQTWCGLTRLREVIAPLRPRLRTFRDESGVELFDLPDAPLPHPDTEAPVRFLPEFDNLTLSHADRARIIAPEYQGRTWDRNVAHRVLLVDGTVRGLWRIDTAGGAAQLTIEAFAPLTGAERAAVEDEAAGVLRMTAPDASYDIRYGRVAKGATP